MFHKFSSLADLAPDAPAVIDSESGTTVTRAELLRQAESLANHMERDRVAARSIVGIQMPNSAAFVATVLAVAKLDAVALLIDRDASAAEVGAISAQFGIHAHSPALPAGARIVKLTSGSTGKPKGIVMSEENLEADATQIGATMDIRPDDINFGAIPMSHSYGFSNLVMPLLIQGTPVVISNDYLPQAIIDRCNRYRCTVMPGIPMVFDHLSSTPAGDGQFTTVRTFISAGAPLSASVSRRFRERFGKPIHSFYGCSECGGIAYDRTGAAAERGNVGTAMENVRLTTKSHRLVVHGSSVALGYLVDATTFEPFDEGRFVADDLAEISADGTVVLTGRASELINTAGRKVNPREVEEILMQIEGVRQVKVYGEPAGARGEVVAAAIVASPDVTRENVRAFCRERLSPHKVPRIVKLIKEIPVDERGKIRRAALAAL